MQFTLTKLLISLTWINMMQRITRIRVIRDLFSASTRSLTHQQSASSRHKKLALLIPIKYNNKTNHSTERTC